MKPANLQGVVQPEAANWSTGLFAGTPGRLVPQDMFQYPGCLVAAYSWGGPGLMLSGLSTCSSCIKLMAEVCCGLKKAEKASSPPPSVQLIEHGEVIWALTYRDGCGRWQVTVPRLRRGFWWGLLYKRALPPAVSLKIFASGAFTPHPVSRCAIDVRKHPGKTFLHRRGFPRGPGEAIFSPGAARGTSSPAWL